MRHVNPGYQVALWTLLTVGFLGGCLHVDDGGVRRPSGSGPVTIRVPADAPTIQEAVDAARVGDLVLIDKGVYTESVKVYRPGITVRGADRNGVVIDGQFRRGNGITVTASRTAVENLTVRNHLFNGVLFTGVTDDALHGAGAGGRDYSKLDTSKFPPLIGFRATHVTAYNNALYGIYAFDARVGVIKENYASGHADSGVYVGQCKPCDVRVEANVTERNAVGMEFTNASVGISVVGNRITHNRVGLTIATDMLESYAPQAQILVAGNAIVDNAEASTPAQAEGGFGIGVGISGGSGNEVTRNLISGHPGAGIVVADALDFPARDNRIDGNRQVRNREEVVTTSAAAMGSAAVQSGAAAPPGMSFRDVPAPAEQPGMPDPAALPVAPAGDPPGAVDVASVPVPANSEEVPAVLESR
ncbi:right-handed parallel beta-helix repeat-containing protein [Phytohabitans sp. ZYX-F-186]|uniref:Right-handed parallel beta-helix repeat-containing protein n=1 Tax=Phytohabitans maris TaxID=3071409 RepID=A0ABU0ZVC3_9ACTN|nr:right-handed parallel beta-helix repeat-containing protein [Phytohabitans sp. ZYX-F-186]MDQ7910996.1 right-handed parallel beta-helix repeat-containing protein [Phytohabitans sp. ZYX-F-186]